MIHLLIIFDYYVYSKNISFLIVNIAGKTQQNPTQLLLLLMSDDVYEVEAIVDCRTNTKGKKQYLVKWAGYSSDDNTWEKSSNLVGAWDLVREFKAKRKRQIQQARQAISLPQENISQFVVAPANSKAKSEQKQQKHKNTIVKKQQQQYQQHQVQQQRQQYEEVKAKQFKSKKPISKQPKSKSDLTILGLNKEENGDLLYLVRQGGQNKLLTRKDLQPKYLKQICDFYESYVVFD